MRDWTCLRCCSGRKTMTKQGFLSSPYSITEWERSGEFEWKRKIWRVNKTYSEEDDSLHVICTTTTKPTVPMFCQETNMAAFNPSGVREHTHCEQMGLVALHDWAQTQCVLVINVVPTTFFPPLLFKRIIKASLSIFCVHILPSPSVCAVLFLDLISSISQSKCILLPGNSFHLSPGVWK